MKIVVAPQGFKGNLTALQVARAIETGIRRIVPLADTVLKPMADGGEGTMQALVDATGGQVMPAEVSDPLGRRITAHWGLLGDRTTAVVEMAAASGLTLLSPDERNPVLTSTYGTGELIMAALNAGCRKFIIGIGGSATNDGGAGMAAALGVRFLDSRGETLPPGGGALSRLAHIDASGIDKRLDKCDVVVACDVDSPLCGPRGASAVYGPQKGATPDMAAGLDAALAHYADVVKRDLGSDARDVPGAGAAGGLGLGLMVFLKARSRPGVEIVIQLTRLADVVRDADLVFVAEGRIDCQTACGKAPVGVSRLARRFGVPVIALAGEVADDCGAVYEQGIDAVLSIAPGPISVEQSMARAEDLISNAAEGAMRLFTCKTR